MPVDRARDLIETLLEAVEPCRERLYLVGNEVESGGLWQPSAVCTGRDDLTSVDGGRSAGVGLVWVGSIIPSDAVFRALAPSTRLQPRSRPHQMSSGRATPGEDSLPGQHRDGPPRSTMSPIERRELVPRRSSCREMRARPRFAGDYTPAGQARAIGHDRRHPAAMRSVSGLLGDARQSGQRRFDLRLRMLVVLHRS